MERKKIVQSFEIVVDPFRRNHLQVALNGLSGETRAIRKMELELSKDENLIIETSQDTDGEVTIDIRNIAFVSSEHTPGAFAYLLKHSVEDLYPNVEVGIRDPHHRVSQDATDFPIRR